MPRHRRAHRVDVRSGHHDYFGNPAFDERTDDPRQHRFAHLTERQSGLRLAHSCRCAGGQNDP